jgi:hypothetical protein
MTEPGRAALASVLDDKSQIVVAKAASIIGRAKLDEFADRLEKAFARFLVNPVTTDKGCIAKLAIAKTLYELGVGTEAIFAPGVRHVQLEPSFGGPADTAAELRGICALGLVRIGYRDMMTELADLLMDPERQTRIMAARALAYAGREEGALLLRVKILAGDTEADVMGECFTALLKLTPAKGLRLIAKLLDSENDDIAAEAGLAIGSSRTDEAYTLLKQKWDSDLSPASRQRLLLPLAMLRRPEATQLLLDVIRRSSAPMACSAIDALGMYRSDPEVKAQVTEAIEDREDAVKRAAAKIWG